LRSTGIEVALHTKHDLESALHCLNITNGEIMLILLDWLLHSGRGDVILKRLRGEPNLASIPIVVFTVSDDPSDVIAAYRNGANGYLVKPSILDDLVQCVRQVCRFWLVRNRFPAVEPTILA
jgi:DNA-binding NarL/FixJ family response regulator